MTSLSVDKNPSDASGGSDLVPPVRIWLDGAFDMMHYGPFPRQPNSQLILLIPVFVVE